MKHIKAPEKFGDIVCDAPSIFLGGSIEGDTASRWQDKVVEYFKDDDIIILNPRRDAWDNSWGNTVKDPRFVEQVQWELDGLDTVDLILMYFDPSTKSPISLLELGLHSTSNILVCCPEGFWRKGNVDIVCNMYGIVAVDNFDEMLVRTSVWLTKKQRMSHGNPII